MRPGSTTVKCPTQSARSSIFAARMAPTPSAGGIGNRSSIIPDDAGNPTCQASSPKSLSKVSSTRLSRAAHANISWSVLPGAAVRIQTISWPFASSAIIASPGKFSLARKRISRGAWIDFFRSQHIASVGKASRKVFVGDPWIVAQNFALSPAIGHEARADNSASSSLAADQPPGE